MSSLLIVNHFYNNHYLIFHIIIEFLRFICFKLKKIITNRHNTDSTKFMTLYLPIKLNISYQVNT